MVIGFKKVHTIQRCSMSRRIVLERRLLWQRMRVVAIDSQEYIKAELQRCQVARPGTSNWFLGIVTQRDCVSRLVLSQPQYIVGMLEDFCMEDCMHQPKHPVGLTYRICC